MWLPGFECYNPQNKFPKEKELKLEVNSKWLEL